MPTKAYLDVAGTAMRERGAWVALLAAALLVAAATVWTYGWLDRYQPDGRGWLPEPAFASGWEVEGPLGAVVTDRGTARLTNTDPEGGVGLRRLLRRVPGDAAVFDLSAVVSTDGLSGGRPRWRGGRVTFSERSRGERMGDQGSVSFPRGRNVELANIRENRAPALYRKRFVIGSDTPAVELAIRLRHASGTLTVSDLRIEGHVERPAFRLAAASLRIGWTLLFLSGLVLTLRRIHGTRRRAVMTALALAGAAIVLTPHSLRETITDFASDDLLGGAVGPETAAGIGHFWLFLALGFATRMLRPRDRLSLQLVALVLLAGASELAQLMADARNPSLADWAADGLGAVVGLVAAWLAARIRSAAAPAAGGPASGETADPPTRQ